jgi:hypothetical protein
VTHTSPDNPVEPVLLGELRSLLVGGGLLEGINLHINQQDGRVQLPAVTLFPWRRAACCR